MKKIIFILALSLLFTNLYSQIKIGIKAGMNISNLQLASSGQTINQSSNATDAPTKIPNNSSLSAPYFGFYSDFKINKKLVLQPEILYSSEGGNEKAGIYNESPGSYNNRFLGYQNLPNHINLIQVPLTLKYNVIDNFNLLFGPQFGFVISHTKNSYPPKSSNFSIQLGGTYLLPKIPVELEIKYALGLNKITDPPKGNYNGYTYDNSERLYVLQIGFGYIFKHNHLKK